MEDDELMELNIVPNKTGKPKVTFKKKVLDTSNLRARSRQPIFENDRINNMETEEEKVKKEAGGEGGELDKPSALVIPTYKKKESFSAMNKRRIDISKYVTIDTDKERENVSRGEETERLDLLELDEEDPENNPVIANLDEFDLTIRQTLKPPSPTPPPLALNSKKYVPISSPSSMPRTSARTYMKELSEEYKNENNYDDGTGGDLELRKHGLEIDDEEHEVNELSDNDMGVLKMPNIDFENKFNREIQSDDDEKAEEAETNGQGRFKEVVIYTIEEQIENLSKKLEEAVSRKRQVDQRKQEILDQKRLIGQSRQNLYEKLRNININ
ncbi:hypothetical protein KGF56_004092 [Candida oxycetoniae]|uniref:Uncharacterized protein n=1 Tax=Candida oxycetoniae TaxID=497107 RepID=A0AAI9SU19_9ASCO|nr:uncharacterized protein KGF56_004092 [Candida oxycetoniae]KAI3403032.2 hypothetical protein KGF56_004092 [Candida oxycetoniae]